MYQLNNQLLNTATILSNNLKVFGEMVFNPQLSLSETLTGTTDENRESVKLAFNTMVDSCAYEARRLSELVDNCSKRNYTLDVMTELMTNLTGIMPLYNEALVMMQYADDSEIEYKYMLYARLNGSINRIYTVYNSISMRYGPITDFGEIEKTLTEILEPCGFAIDDYSLSLEDIKFKSSNTKIVEVKLLILLKKLEQGGTTWVKDYIHLLTTLS